MPLKKEYKHSAEKCIFILTALVIQLLTTTFISLLENVTWAVISPFKKGESYNYLILSELRTK